LSEDPVECREFRVEGGIIVEFVSMTEGRTYETGNGKNKKIVPCHIDGWQHGQHDLGWDIDHNALTIQLMPYKDTPNKGGVYKVWATPIEEFDGDPTKVDNGYKPGYFHGFIPRYSKTDNFKVKQRGRQPETPEVEICKFEDTNGNGVWDANEPTISSWMITVTDPLGISNDYYTDDDGCVTIYAPMDGDYVITETVLSDWSVTATIVDGTYITPTDSVTISVNAKTSVEYTVTFGNFQCFDINGHKYNDLDGDGVLDSNEPGISGWKIMLMISYDGGSTWELTRVL
jgi:archaellum component FlaF (FlaF/FlaG flagellin family)